MPPIPNVPARVAATTTTKITATQSKVLKVLAASPGLLSRKVLYDELGYTHRAGLNDVLGRNDPEKRSFRDKKHPSLITLGYVEVMNLDIEGVVEIVYRITPAGRNALKEY